jgi:hypothetical protein
MKPKKFQQKLSLNKVTVVNLDGARAGAVAEPTQPFCPVTGDTDCHTNCVHSECYHYTCEPGCSVSCEEPCTVTVAVTVAVEA